MPESVLSFDPSPIPDTFPVMENERIINPGQREDDDNRALRPSSLDEFIGQEQIKQTLRICMEAAKQRGQAVDHVLLSGPPGLGKTTLAHIIKQEMEVGLKTTSGPTIERKDDLAALLTDLQNGDVLFIDEIHRLNRIVEECLYPAMEDYFIDILIGEGPHAKSIRLELPHFSLIGATTRTGLLTGPLRDRFGIHLRVEFYQPEEILQILKRSAKLMKVSCEPGGLEALATRSRGTPRIANRLLRRVRDYAQVRADGCVTEPVTIEACELLGVDRQGLDPMDRQILSAIVEKFDGGPVGIKTIAAALGEDEGTLEEVYEPYLLQIGFLQRTPNGRVATRRAYEHLGLKAKNPADVQEGLFD